MPRRLATVTAALAAFALSCAAPVLRAETPSNHAPSLSRPPSLAQAPAETPAPRPDAPDARALRPGEESFDAESWRAYAGGRTIAYFDDKGVRDGLERFAPRGDLVEWRFEDGRCSQGRWTERDGIFCFRYPDGEFCYRHVRRDGAVRVRNIRTGLEFIARPTEKRLGCVGPSVRRRDNEPLRLTELRRDTR